MRVVCDNCSAQYKIPDQKLVKEVNKATCRKCGHRMLIRRPTDSGSADDDPHDEADHQSALYAAARSLDAFDDAPLDDWEDDGPTKIRRDDPVSEEDDARPTTPGLDSISPAPSVPPPPQRARADVNNEPTPRLGAPPPRSAAPPPVRSVLPQRADASPMPAPAAAYAPAPVPGTAAVYDPTADMGWVTLGTLASIAGTLLLAANLTDSSIQRFLGLLLALGGGMTALFVLSTGRRGAQKANVLLSVAISGVLAAGGAVAMHLLHAGFDALITVPIPAQTVAVNPLPPPPASASSLQPPPSEVTNTQAEELLASAPAPQEVVPTPPREPETTPPPATTTATERTTPPSTSTTASSGSASSSSQTEERSSTSSTARTSTSGGSSSGGSTSGSSTSGSSSRSTPPPPPVESTTPASSVLLPSVIDTMLKNNSKVLNCFQLEYKQSGSLPPQLPIGFEVQSTGKVSSMWVKDSQYQGSKLESCLRSAIYGIQFPPFEGEPAKMKYTFRIQ